MRIRYDTATRRVKHISVPPFTVPVAGGEADREIADAPHPGPVFQLRLTADFAALEIDPALVPVPPTDDETFVAGFDTGRLLRACMAATLSMVNDLRTDPLTVKPAITPGAWRQRVLDAYKALG